MAWRKEAFGKLPGGGQADKYILTNAHGVSAAFTSLGGIWLDLMAPDRTGRLADVLMGYDRAEKCLECSGHLGELVGRYANRIGGASYCLNGVRHQLAVNDNGVNNLHSGPDFYRNRLWDAEVKERGEDTAVTFSLTSPDGDQGYPGNAEIAVTYTLTADDSVRIDYRLKADADTIVNMTNHAYFNLAGHETGEILAQQVWIDGDHFTPVDSHSVPTGEIAPVRGTAMDFTVMKPIGQDIAADEEQLHFTFGYDHNWVLNHAPGVLALSAKVYDPASGRVMEVYTDQPGIQFYTANYMGQAAGKGGVTYGPRCGYCFETQNFPDAVNKPQFPSPVLKAGEEYRTTTIYHFTTK